MIFCSSCGGHLVQLKEIARLTESSNIVYVVNNTTSIDIGADSGTIAITHAERNIFELVVNLVEAIILVLLLRPTVILSTGASIALPFVIVSKISKSKFVFVESLSRIHTPSLTARLVYPLADLFIVQWPALLSYFPKAHFFGSVL